MEARIAPSTRIAEAIEALLSSGVDTVEQLPELGRLGAQLVIQHSVEDEVTAFLQRARYQRTPAAQGSRNGVRSRTIQTAEGPLEIQVPQMRGTVEEFVSQVLPNTRAAIRTRPLEALIIGAYVRGLSDRDVESLVKEAGLGEISKSTVSRICKELRDRYRAFRERSLATIDLLVLFLDAIYLPTRPSGPKEGVLVAWGYDSSGTRVLLDVCLGQRERYEDWMDMGRGLARRGLAAPLLWVTDGAPGAIRAGEELWPDAGRQRCSVHKLRNVLAKLPKDEAVQKRVRDAYWEALNEATSAEDAEHRLRTLVTDLATSYPSAAACLADDLPALTVHLRYPLHLRRRLRSTNLLERSLEEVRRRTKVIGRFPGETSCLTMSWAVLDLFISASRGLGLTELDRQRMRRDTLAHQDLTDRSLIA